MQKDGGGLDLEGLQGAAHLADSDKLLADCQLLAADGGEPALGAALAMHAALCGAGCSPALPAGAPAHSRAKAGAESAAEREEALGAVGEPGGCARGPQPLLAHAATAVALLLDTASGLQVRRMLFGVDEAA